MTLLFCENTLKWIYLKMPFREMRLDPLSTRIEGCEGTFLS